MTLENFRVCDGDLDEDLLNRYSQGSVLAVDTETMGLLPARDRLCLVQLCDISGMVSVVRIQRGQTQAPRLKQLLEAATVEKIFHFARFDVAMLQQHLGIQTQPIFCTKIASKLARTYTSSHGLKALVMELEGVELDKRAQSSDWGNAANLCDQQLSYAANDVRYLIALKQTLTMMLQREERWQLAQDCFAAIPVFVALDLLHYSNVFEH
ncbi:MAG: ribonuclease D [Phormidium sp. GEM2.Bin31]|nr:MAG: ribonuclease D [Phormidium sp. GEM2.Bin31]